MKITVAPDGMLTYRYTCGPDCSFSLHLLCEVGAPYQRAALAETARQGLKVEYARDLPAAPWVADFAVSKRADPLRDTCRMRTV